MTQDLICWLKWAVHALAQTFLDALDFLLTGAVLLVNLALAVLPAAAVARTDPLDGKMLGTLNYFIPIGMIVSQLGVFIVAWGLYRFYQWLIRFAKAEG